MQIKLVHAYMYMYMSSNYSESEDDTAEKEFGAVGDKEEKKEEEGLDRNMWAPEEDEEQNEVNTIVTCVTH